MTEPRITYHLTPVPVWTAQASNPTYEPEGFAAEGFVHCTDGEQRVLETGDRYYTADPRPFCVLSIEVAKLTAQAIYEDDARVFPHIYGPIDVVAVRAVRMIERDPSGRFIAIGDEPTLA